MSRGLSSTVISTLSSNAFQVAVMVKIELTTEFNLTSSQQDIVWTVDEVPTTYTSSGVFMNIADIKEEASINTGAIKLRLGNASQTLTNLLISGGHIDKTVTIYLALLDDSADVIDSPFEIFKGTISGMNIKDFVKSSVVSLTVANHWAQLKNHAGRTVTDSSQQMLFNGDKCFNFASQVGKSIVWGTSPEYTGPRVKPPTMYYGGSAGKWL